MDQSVFSAKVGHENSENSDRLFIDDVLTRIEKLQKDIEDLRKFKEDDKTN